MRNTYRTDPAIKFTLTERERQVLDMVRQGQARSEIAKMLGISLNAVGVRLTIAAEKEQAAGRADLDRAKYGTTTLQDARHGRKTR